MLTSRRVVFAKKHVISLSSSTFSKNTKRNYKTHEFEEDELNLHAPNLHPHTTPLKHYREKLKDTTLEEKNGEYIVNFPEDKKPTFEEYLEEEYRKTEVVNQNYGWPLGLQLRQSLHDVEKHAAASYIPILKYKKEDLREYKVANQLGTIWTEEEAKRPITLEDVEEAIILYKDHCERKKMMKPEYSLEYTKLIKVLTSLVSVNRDFIKFAQNVYNTAASQHQKDITTIESTIESELKKYLLNQSEQDKLLLIKPKEYTIGTIHQLNRDLDTFENMIVEVVKLMYIERCLIYDLELCKKLLTICYTSTASSLEEKRKELNDITNSHYDRQTLFEQAYVISKESEHDNKVLNQPYELSRPLY
ncbi:hypothetical protein ABK040_010182 [Willaertia magna]